MKNLFHEMMIEIRKYYELKLDTMFSKVIIILLEEVHHGLLIVKIGLQMVIGHIQNKMYINNEEF